MGWFRRRSRPGQSGPARTADLAHLEAFAGSRRGVEAFIEPRTTVTETTLVLVAVDGEWTRRRVPGPDAARDLGRRLGIPVYDANLVGYPKRMREWTSRRKAAGDTGVPRGQSGRTPDPPAG
ncbi:MAG: hypothetical protein HY241_00870 [Actinobacteria bacterium]|nr:hypothetical protein [Actinomycetota bacterium]